MVSFVIEKISRKKSGKISLEIDANKLERLAANFGFFNPDFLRALSKAEKDFACGNFQKIKSLKELD
ncbi:MAG: hypothetical protein PHW31_01030 [Candidatus Pacebacteria bacterium]|nr:hypothetical protein [Candidatus Paceibacterota bacterium]